MAFPALRDSSMQGIFRQVEKDDEKAPLTQGLYHKFLNGLIVDLQGSSPTFGMQVTLHGAGVESRGMQSTSNQCYLNVTVRNFGHLYMT